MKVCQWNGGQVKAPIVLNSLGYSTDAAREVLRHKLSAWKHEHEARIIEQRDYQSGDFKGELIKTGTITAVYVGTPLRDVSNRNQIYQNSKAWRDYHARVKDVVRIAKEKDIQIKSCRIRGSRVAVGAYREGELFDCEQAAFDPLRYDNLRSATYLAPFAIQRPPCRPV